MPDRPRIAIPFGGGIDRESGVMAVDKSAFSDIRNFHLRMGKMVLRNGLGNTGAMFGSATDIVAIHPIRARAKGAVLTYDFAEPTTALTLWIVDADGTNPVEVPIILPFNGGVAVPRFILTDVYGRLFMAHETPDINARISTLVYNLNTGAFEGITGLDGTPQFRGVQRYLNYLVGWGWGTGSDPDRPETFRISLPGQPTVFDPQHYFLVGQQGEAVMMADTAGQILAVKKLSETYQLKGYDRASFGMVPLDGQFGQITPRLSVSVGNVNYFWSESGPRRTGGGPSEDLALPLDLGGPSPDALATFDTDDAFAYYDHDNREVVFNFGQWQYVLHLSDPSNLRWSYNQLGVKVGAAGVFYELDVSTPAAPPSVVTTLVAFIAATQSTMTWSVTIAGAQDPTDSLEWWVKELVTGAWVLKKSELLAGRTAFTSTVTGLFAGYPSDWAIRPVRAGVPGVSYPTGNPATWPVATRHIADALAFTTNPAPIFVSATYFDLAVDELRMTFSPYTGSHAGLVYEIEVSDGVGGWTPVTEQDQEIERVTAQVTAFAGMTRDVRARRHPATGGGPDSAWTTFAGVVFTDALADLITALVECSIYLADRDVLYSPGVALEWHGTDQDSADVTPLLSGDGTSATVPTFNTVPARVSFDGGDDFLADYLATIGTGFTICLVLKCTEVGATVRPVYGQVSAPSNAKPTLKYNAAGKLEYNLGDIPLSAANEHGNWIFVAYSQAAGVAAGEGYDGNTSLGADAGADADCENPTILSLLRSAPFGTSTGFFKGDVFAIVISPLAATGGQISDAYDALVALALAAGITVTN